MTIVYTDAHLAHQPPHEIYEGELVAYAEKAARAEVIIKAIREQGEHRIIAPKEFPIEHIYAVHQRSYVDFLQKRSEKLEKGRVLYPSYFISDTYAPVTPGTYVASCQAVNVALTAAEQLLTSQQPVYALCRPPGHHAEHHSMGGYCYFNNAAVAAMYLSAQGKVAILDIDLHHGNGTQHTFYDRDDVLYVSLHADPSVMYPHISGFTDEQGRGAGLGYTINYPMPLGTGDKQYLAKLHQALQDIQHFKPDFLVVSVGFDTFIKDPIGGFKLTIPVYKQLASHIADLQLPTLLVQEGGYNVEHLGMMATTFLSGLQPR